MATTGGLFIPVVFSHFALALTGKKSKSLPWLYAQALLVSLLYCSGFVHYRLAYLYDSFYYVTNVDRTYDVVTFAWVLPAVYGHLLLLRSLKTASEEKRLQIRYLLFAFFIGFLSGGVTHFFTVYGYSAQLFWNVFIAFYVLISTYAIFRHKLLGIDLAVRKSLVYALLISLITSLYFLLLVLIEKVFQKSMGYTSPLFTFAMFGAIILLAEPLRHLIQSFIDRFFFKSSITEIIKERELFHRRLEQQDRLKAVATLAAGMAHEIKNPLTSIRTFAEYLPVKYNDPEFRDNFKRIVVDEVDRVNNIVKQLLEFSKPNELNLNEEYVIPILDDTLELLNNNLVSNRIEAVKDYHANIKLRVDRNQLRQAFLNIFLNAIQAMPNGGKLSIFAFQTVKNELLIRIQDTGCGIPKEQLAHIFDPFFTTKEAGTGLGLSIVHGIITKHGGKVEVKSVVGRGTEFSVILRN